MRASRVQVQSTNVGGYLVLPVVHCRRTSYILVQTIGDPGLGTARPTLDTGRVYLVRIQNPLVCAESSENSEV